MSRTLSSVRERHKPVELGTRSTHGSSEFGFDPTPPINPYYGSQSAVEAERNVEPDGVGLRLPDDLALTGAPTWDDLLSVTLSGGLWLLVGTAGASAACDFRIFDGTDVIATATGSDTVPLNALVLPRGGATYTLQASGTGDALGGDCSLVAVRAYA